MITKNKLINVRNMAPSYAANYTKLSNQVGLIIFLQIREPN